jgi:hypothetical protein
MAAMHFGSSKNAQTMFWTRLHLNRRRLVAIQPGTGPNTAGGIEPGQRFELGD